MSTTSPDTSTVPSRNTTAAKWQGFNSWRKSAYRNQMSIDFAKLWKHTILISVLIVVASVAGFFGRGGLNLGIEFEGGVSWEITAPNSSISEIRDALGSVDMTDARIQSLGGDLYRIRAEGSETNTAEIRSVQDALAGLDGVDRDEISHTAVGPSWGSEITRDMRNALIVFFIVIAIYIWLRLEWRMTLAALVAVVHDIVVTVGIYAIFQLEVTPATVFAFLTILGYSLYDTLVVFDKIRENESRLSASRRHTYTQLVVSSTNQVFMRSINTTITSVLPVLALLVVGSSILGSVTLQEFAVALLVGLIAGTYSSLFVATPITARLKEKEPHWQEVRYRLSQYGAVSSTVSGEATSAESSAGRVSAQSLRTAPSPQRRRSVTSQSRVRTQRTHPPRPRKKKK